LLWDKERFDLNIHDFKNLDSIENVHIKDTVLKNLLFLLVLKLLKCPSKTTFYFIWILTYTKVEDNNKASCLLLSRPSLSSRKECITIKCDKLKSFIVWNVSLSYNEYFYHVCDSLVSTALEKTVFSYTQL